MKIQKFIPSDVLKPFIKTYMVIESDDEIVNKVLPDTLIVMAFRLKGETFANNGCLESIPASAVTGINRY